MKASCSELPRCCLKAINPDAVKQAAIKYKNQTLIAYTVFFPLFLFVALETLNPASSAGLMSSPFVHILPLMTSVLLLVFMGAFLFGLVGSVFVSYGIVTVLWLIIYAVNHFKLMITGGVFVPTDILVAGAAMAVMEDGSINITFGFVLRVLMVLALLVPLYFVKIKLHIVRRLVLAGIMAIVVMVFFTGSFAVNRTFPSLGLHQGTVSDRYRDSGLVLGFYSALIEHNVPTQVDLTHMWLLTDEPWYSPASVVEETPAQTMPNVIVIMSEAFMDPTTMYNLTFSQYPIPNFRRLSEEHVSGNVLVPVYGGGTANTELEFIAGTPHMFFGSRFYIPFENPAAYFTQNIYTTLPWMFRAHGYRAIAVHPFYGDFFNRTSIYPLLGFEQFIASEDMPDALYKGPFISDEYFTDRIIEQILIAEDADQPLFLYGISMQNHWGFEPMKYDTLDLDVMAESSYLNEDELQQVNSFLQGIFDADRELGRLVDFVEDRDTPTIIVFFGDHLPILGLHEDRVFERLGWLTSQDDHLWELEDRVKIFSTPYLVWANYDLGAGEWGDLSTFLLSAHVADVSGVGLNRYFTYLLNSRRYFRGITNELYLDYNGEFHPAWLNRNNPYVLALEALWHSKFFGGDSFHSSLREIVE